MHLLSDGRMHKLILVLTRAGQSSHRQSWSQYFQATSGVILVIDSSDQARMDVVKQELHKMMADEVSL